MAFPTRIIDFPCLIAIDAVVASKPYDATASIAMAVTALKSFPLDGGFVLAGAKLTLNSDRVLAMVDSGAVSLDDPDHAAALALVDGPADQRHARFLATLSHFTATTEAQP
jgi:hypothetical protein